jgi:two-component system sensor histidine kinase HydH
MKIKPLSRDAAAGALSWLLTGTVVLLVMLFSAMIVRDYGRETTAARQTIEEKGSVLIRALESGTRVGMGMRMHHAQLQALLEEMAWQPGVLWFAVTDENGKIIAHSDPQQVGKTLYSPAQMRALAVGEQARWRRLSEPQPALEIYRHFRPLNPARGHHMGMMNRGNSALAQATVPQVIFIAFDSRELDAAQARGQRNMAIMLGAAALVIAATILAQFWFRRYRRSRKQLLEAMARKEKLVALGHLAAGSRTRSATRSRRLKGWRNILPSARRLAASRIS